MPPIIVLRVLLIVSMVASTAHFADNALAIEQYPEPGWFTPVGIAGTWLLVTSIAVVALARKSIDWTMLAASGMYAVAMIDGLLHYLYASPMQMAMRSNTTVIAEATLGSILLGAVLITGCGKVLHPNSSQRR